MSRRYMSKLASTMYIRFLYSVASHCVVVFYPHLLDVVDRSTASLVRPLGMSQSDSKHFSKFTFHSVYNLAHSNPWRIDEVVICVDRQLNP